MNTTYKPVDREFLEMLAAAKARGITWMRLAEMTKKPVVELEVIPWREPKEWAKACKYAEKLMQHEALSETLAQLRVQMNDNINNARSKSQIANSMVRVIQLQHTLRTPKKPKKAKAATPDRQPPSAPLAPIEPPTPTPAQPTEVKATVPMPTPAHSHGPRESNVARNTVVAALLLLFGLLAFWSTAHADDSSAAIIVHEHNHNTATADLPISLFDTVVEERCAVCSPWDGRRYERLRPPVDSSPPTGETRRRLA